MAAQEFDRVYGPAWHCIVGSSFGSFVTHSTGCFLYFSMEKLCILLFKTKIQKALDWVILYIYISNTNLCEYYDAFYKLSLCIWYFNLILSCIDHRSEYIYIYIYIKGIVILCNIIILTSFGSRHIFRMCCCIIRVDVSDLGCIEVWV
jgi:hypothetical protein